MLKQLSSTLAILTLAIGLNTNPSKAGESVEADQTKMHASWYGPGLQGNHMANGDVFDMNDPTVVAHKSLPFGTKLLLENPATGAELVVVVQDRGPFIAGRQLDLSKAAASRLGFLKRGTATLVVTRLN
jgi:rare lipoprotein A